MGELGYDGCWPSAEPPSGLPAQRLLALSASDKLRVTTLDFTGQKGSVFPLATWHTVLPGEEELRAFRAWVCFFGS